MQAPSDQNDASVVLVPNISIDFRLFLNFDKNIGQHNIKIHYETEILVLIRSLKLCNIELSQYVLGQETVQILLLTRFDKSPYTGCLL